MFTVGNNRRLRLVFEILTNRLAVDRPGGCAIGVDSLGVNIRRKKSAIVLPADDRAARTVRYDNTTYLIEGCGTNGDTVGRPKGVSRQIQLLGVDVCIISGGTNAAVKSRLQGLGITDIYLGAHNKIEQLDEYLDMNTIDATNVLYMGDDIPDIPVMKICGLATCPKDAAPEVQRISGYISQKKGGKGCVRDVIEQVLKVQDKWHDHFDAKYD